MWITKLKIAIVEKNTDSIDKLLNDIPELTDGSEVEEAIYLLKEATELLHTLQDETTKSMKKIKKNIEFLRSTESKASTKLDIKL
ncbi:hypothetical protein N9A28_08600 [Sulfurimonas sp.]|nr:hypothetical protein [Sulfurimonas sp.]